MQGLEYGMCRVEIWVTQGLAVWVLSPRFHHLGSHAPMLP